MNHFGGKQSFLRKHRQVCFSLPPSSFSPTERRWQTRGKQAKSRQLHRKSYQMFFQRKKTFEVSAVLARRLRFPSPEMHSALHEFHSRKLPTKHAQTQHGSCSIKISILILETKASYSWHFSAETNVGVECAKRRQINRKQNCFTAFFIFLCFCCRSSKNEARNTIKMI